MYVPARPLLSVAEQEGSGQFRVVITKEANECLESAASKVNMGFEAGAVTRSDIANYIFSNLVKLFTDADVQILRRKHFDDRKMLNTILKSDEELPEDIRRALREHFGLAEREKKRALRAAPELSTERNVDTSNT